MTSKEISDETRLTQPSVWRGVLRCWEKGLVLRSEKPIFEVVEKLRGRLGYRRNTSSFYYYVVNPRRVESLAIKGQRFVAYDKNYLDARGSKKTSKAQLILTFLKENSARALFSKEIFDALTDKGVKNRDVMGTVRRYNGLIYVRGYRSDERQTPFKEGYLITWLDQNKTREQAIEEAIERTDKALSNRSTTNPVIERIHFIRDRILESSKLRDLASVAFLQSELGLSEYEIENAVNRTLQLYSDLKETKLFNTYRYFYHDSLSGEELKASIAMKENYVRKTKGRENRIGHNWEAVPEWFLDKFTTGAKFWTQEHRLGRMDPQRITLHLLKPVGGRRNNAEVDRVWEVTPGLFSQPITYVLECKWGLIKKKYINDFFEVLRWSKEFGTDTPDGRQVKQGIIGVFAGSSFDPKESVQLKDETKINLSSYASRMNVQLLKASDFNEKLREKGVQKDVTVQKICRVSKGEKEVRSILEVIWNNPDKSGEILSKVAANNESVYEFEKMLEEK